MAFDRTLFDTEFLQKLGYLSLVSKRLHRGRARGEHLTYRKGSSLEFFDYRSYEPGDDFRYIDWSIFNRLDRLVVKLFAAEEDLSIHLLVDTSLSMDFGEPKKIDYARKVAAALGYIGITSLDRVGVSVFSSELNEFLPPHRGRNQLFSLFDALSKIRPGGRTSLSRSLGKYSLQSRQSGLVIVISDLFDPEGYESAIQALLHKRYDVVLLQILNEQELSPTEKGELKLVDAETGESERFSVDSECLLRYQETLMSFFKEIEQFCLKRGVEYLRIITSTPFEDLILKYLRQGMHLH